ncbi:HNH endonuclease [Dactylosporangium sp. McL0621]|uniref:HNH endonuclease n=1 Tax=Dactylosporangium sp. McL0621 TaxID=3415678 RepID=UPI003CEF7E98
MADRPDVPAELKRRLMIEAGHRCAIPTCRQIGPLQIEHIDDWAKVQRHDFENMIVLCANCHGRKGTRHGEIDRKSLRQYKANLAILNSRYSDLERRVLEVLADQREAVAKVLAGNPHLAPDLARGLSIQLPSSLRLLMMYLIKDGYMELSPPGTRHVAALGSTVGLTVVPAAINSLMPDTDFYRLTPAGVEFLDAWLGAKPLDPDSP